MSAPIIRWGILGTGRAAIDFALGLRHVSGSILSAVGSRTADKAERFARCMGVRRACRSYEELASDPTVDVIYIATPNSLHRSHCLLALGAGKAVLCEKPFAMNSAEAQEVINFARQKNLFCMEAMWMHFLPGMQKAMELVQTGTIGQPRMLTADFGVPTKINPSRGEFSIALGGGAMMDRGVYPLALAWRLFGVPVDVDAMSTLTASGVDEHTSVIIKYRGGQIALLAATLTGYAANEAVIIGTEGRITIHEPLCRPDRLTISRAPILELNEQCAMRPGIKDRLRSSHWARKLRRYFPGRAKTVYAPFVGNGYNYEASEVVRCMTAGAIESPVWPLDQTAGVIQTLDLIRKRKST